MLAIAWIRGRRSPSISTAASGPSVAGKSMRACRSPAREEGIRLRVPHRTGRVARDPETFGRARHPCRVENGTFIAEEPREWSPQRLADTGVLSNFDLAPDGTRGVALLPAAEATDEQSPSQAWFALNFPQEVVRRTLAGLRPDVLLIVSPVSSRPISAAPPRSEPGPLASSGP